MPFALLERIEKIVAAEPAHSRAIGIGACMLADLNERERAKEWVIRARLVDPENINLHYNLACAMASLNETDLALETLEADTDLDSLRDEPRFKALMAQVSARLKNSRSAG